VAVARDLDPSRFQCPGSEVRGIPDIVFPAEAIAAELTNHLVDGAVLTPGIVATIPELQQAGFHYAK
jgi:hypothetical protein